MSETTERCCSRCGAVLVRLPFRRMRDALLEGHALEASGIGEFAVHQRDAYALVHPVSGQTRALRGERTILFRQDRQLLKELNAKRGGGHVA